MLGKTGLAFLKFVVLVLGMSLLMGAVPSSDVPSSVQERDQMTLRMVQLARAGRIAEARDTIKNYLGNNPTDGTMHYNLACLDLLLKETDQAFEDFERALENGYTNFRLIEADNDLNLLRPDPRFAEMVARYEDAFLVKFQNRALYLDEGYASGEIVLEAANLETASLKLADPEMVVQYNKDSIQISVSVEDPSYTGENSPWEDGCGVLVNLIQPLSPDDYESRYYYSYGFFEDHGQPRSTLVGKHGKILLQSAPGLTPVITRQGNVTQYEIVIPWDALSPYGPPLDQEMGLNVFYLGKGKGDSRLKYSLMAEKRTSFEADPWRRYVPLYFLTSDRSVPQLQGRLYDRLCQSDDLGLQFAHWSASEGEAKFQFTIHPQNDPQKSMLPPIVESEPCETELNFFNFYLDMADLPEGSYTVRVALTGPSGASFVEEYPFDNFEDGWLRSLNERVHHIKTTEQSILKYHLFSLTSEVEKRLNHSNAAVFHEKYAAMVRMIELCENGSSCLPQQGLFQGGFTSEIMTQRRCAMYLPEGFRDIKNPHLLMVLPPSPGSENDLATSLGKAFAGNSDVIVLVPQSHGFSSLATDAAARHTILAMEWARNLFQADKITLVGLGTGSDAALEASLRRPDLCRRVLFDGDKIYADLVGFSGPKIVEALDSRTNQLQYTAITGQSSPDRAKLVTESMANLGYNALIYPLDGEIVFSTWLPSWLLGKD